MKTKDTAMLSKSLNTIALFLFSSTKSGSNDNERS